MFQRAELKILGDTGQRIKAISNDLSLDETTDFGSINVHRNKVYYTETLYTDYNFQTQTTPEGQPLPYLDDDGVPEKITKIRLSFNGTSYDVTAAQIGSGVDFAGNRTWFTEDDTQTGKPVTSKFIEWLDINL